MIQALDLLSLWERGSSRHSLDRSALLCAWVRHPFPAETIVDLPLGEVTATLLQLRAGCFGEQIAAHVDCESCGQRLALTLSVNELLQPGSQRRTEIIDAAGLRFRPPSLRDLAAIAHESDPDQGARRLLERCLVDGSGDCTALSDEALTDIEHALEMADPLADLAFDVRCEACGHSTSAQLEPGALLWDEIDTLARSLLSEVHVLASAYGWSEREILSLSAERRASYLSMVAS
jgi:hypothetical protein